MTKRLPRGASIAALIAAGALAFTGCAASTETPSPSASASTGASASAGVVAPVIADLNDVDGTTVEVTVGNTVDLTGDDESYADWTADIADESVVEFTPGRDDGSAQFNPGLEAVAEGRTEVTLENSSTGDTVTFTVDVTG